MYGRRDDAQDDLTARDDRVNDHRTKEVVGLAEVYDDVAGLFDAALHIDGGDG